MAAFCKACDCCKVQNLICNCEDDVKPPYRPWPPEAGQPCVCHLVPPFNEPKPVEYNLPVPAQNMKGILEPKSMNFSGKMSLLSTYESSYKGKKSEIRTSFRPTFDMPSKEQTVSNKTISSVSYQHWNSEPAKKIRYCNRNILGRTIPPEVDNFSTTYQKDFIQKPKSTRKNFSKKMFFVPSPVPVDNKTLSRATYVPHPTPKITKPQREEIYRPDYPCEVGPTIYKGDYLINRLEKRKKLPWKEYEKQHHQVSEGKVSHASEYNSSFLPLSNHPTKQPLPTGDPCHGVCQCVQPGVCLPNNLNLEDGRKCCVCHKRPDHCEPNIENKDS